MAWKSRTESEPVPTTLIIIITTAVQILWSGQCSRSHHRMTFVLHCVSIFIVVISLFLPLLYHGSHIYDSERWRNCENRELLTEIDADDVYDNGKGAYTQNNQVELHTKNMLYVRCVYVKNKEMKLLWDEWKWQLVFFLWLLLPMHVTWNSRVQV